MPPGRVPRRLGVKRDRGRETSRGAQAGKNRGDCQGSAWAQPGLPSTRTSSSPSARLARHRPACSGPQGQASPCLLLGLLWQDGQYMFAFMLQSPGQVFRKSRIQLVSWPVFRAKAAWLTAPWFEQSDGSMAGPFSAGHLLPSGPATGSAVQTVRLRTTNLKMTRSIVQNPLSVSESVAVVLKK